jgi:translation elongation factor EF-1alpha
MKSSATIVDRWPVSTVDGHHLKTRREATVPEELVGEVSHWFGNINVAGIELSGKLSVGDRVHIVGHTTDFEQEIASMQIENEDVAEASPGDEIGVKLESRARPGDSVYRVF